MRKISVSEALWAIELLPDFLPSTEPIGPITDKGLRGLDAAVEQPFAHFNGRYLYWHMYHRAAILFYMLAKDHAIGNGNKRCAVIVTMVFLFKNGRMFNFTADELYDIALVVAKSEASQMHEVVGMLKALFKHSIVEIPPRNN